jgi:frataxin-like iron-binding protein CyaY
MGLVVGRIGVRSLSEVGGMSRKDRKAAAAAAAAGTNNGLDFDFKLKSEEVLEMIHKALLPLVPLNPVFEIERSANEIKLNTGVKGKYIFRIDHAHKRLFVASPMSGNFHYRYDSSSENWLGTNDNHDMRGLVNRDLLRHCVGLPGF